MDRWYGPVGGILLAVVLFLLILVLLKFLGIYP